MPQEQTSATSIFTHSGVLAAVRFEGAARMTDLAGEQEHIRLASAVMGLFSETTGDTVNATIDGMTINCLRVGSVRVAIVVKLGAPIAKSRARMLRRFAAARRTPRVATFKPEGVEIDLTDGCKIDGVEIAVTDGSINWTRGATLATGDVKP